MNKISNKQLKAKTKRQNWYRNIKPWLKRREKRIKVRQWAAQKFYDYIAYDFLYGLLYMMIHKKFVRWFGIDYHRITGIIRLFQDVYSKNLEESVHDLFGGIDYEDEVEHWIEWYRWEITSKEDNLIITIDEDIDYFNPNKEPDTTRYILPKYMLHNFLQFKKLFYDVVSRKYNVGADTDFWLYACRYLLMGDKEFEMFYRLGPNGRNFPYKLIEEYNPKGLEAILKDKKGQAK
ncbi:MAG: hypothetical protein IJ184_02920 [Alphaproteobacteria bacterium]|nr:hypothetical protein [Alphaproteobacteria bacterium]